MRCLSPTRWCLLVTLMLAPASWIHANAQMLAQAGRAAPVPAPAAPGVMADRELVVTNHSKRTVNELYVSPSTADDWGDDKLGDDTLDPGKNFRVKLGRTRECEFDVQVVYDDASHEESRKVNVCRGRQVAFDGSTAVAAPPVANGSEHTITLVNNDSRPIQQVFVSPADAGDWGDDRLSDDSISVGEQKRLTYSGDCVADLRIVFDNRSAEERRGLNLCDSATLSIQPGWTTADVAPTAPSTTPSPSSTPSPSPSSPPPSASGAAPGTTPAAPTTNVSIVNQSGHGIAEFYLFPDGAKDRGPDRLGAGEINDGGRMTLRLALGGQCHFSAKIVFTGHTPDGGMSGLDLCQSPEIVVKP